MTFSKKAFPLNHHWRFFLKVDQPEGFLGALLKGFETRLLSVSLARVTFKLQKLWLMLLTPFSLFFIFRPPRLFLLLRLSRLKLPPFLHACRASVIRHTDVGVQSDWYLRLCDINSRTRCDLRKLTWCEWLCVFLCAADNEEIFFFLFFPITPPPASHTSLLFTLLCVSFFCCCCFWTLISCPTSPGLFLCFFSFARWRKKRSKKKNNKNCDLCVHVFSLRQWQGKKKQDQENNRSCSDLGIICGLSPRSDSRQELGTAAVFCWFFFPVF